MKRISLFLFALLASGATWAQEQIRIVGSSTVYPFASYVAEEFGALSRYPAPIVESTGTGGGMKLFCNGSEADTPDITNASRRMKIKEFQRCDRNGVSDITELMFGYDGIVLAQDKDNTDFDISKRELLLAVAKKVPDPDGGGLVDNPYTHWNQINPEWPEREITIYGPPVSSGTRDAFEEMVLKYQTEQMKVYRDAGLKGYRLIRTDGHYIPSGENDNLIVKKLSRNQDAFGIFGYSFLAENKDKLEGVTIDGVAPTVESIASKDYPISRSLYFYVKNAHLDDVPAMREYIDLFLSRGMIGEIGLLTQIGLIPLSTEEIEDQQARAAERRRLTLDDLKAALH